MMMSRAATMGMRMARSLSRLSLISSVTTGRPSTDVSRPSTSARIARILARRVGSSAPRVSCTRMAAVCSSSLMKVPR